MRTLGCQDIGACHRLFEALDTFPEVCVFVSSLKKNFIQTNFDCHSAKRTDGGRNPPPTLLKEAVNCIH